MIQTDPIIAVKDVAISSKWYQTLFDCRLSGGHGGEKFETLTDEEGSVLLCLHKWGEDHHPTMTDIKIPTGNGLILYFRTDNLEAIRENARSLEAVIEEDIHRNPNSGKEEFSVWDLDGYYLTITRYHDYGYGYK